MEKQFVTYEIALKLKELGFKESCFGEYWERDDKEKILEYGKELEDLKFQKEETSNVDDMKFMCSAPLWQQVIDWFYEKYKIDIVKLPQYSLEKGWFQYVISGYSFYEGKRKLEDAKISAILKAIEIIKEKNIKL